MTRKQYVGLLLAVVIIGAVLIAYKTPAPVAEPAVIAEFGGVSLRLDYATTAEARERGLSGRENIPSDYGMLFVFPKSDRYGFWMKDMLVPLDIFWLDDKGQVVYIMEDVATSTYPNVFYSTMSARYVLETAAGFVSANSIATGTPLMLKSFPTVSQ